RSAGDSRGLLLRDGRPPQQQLRQPPLGNGAEEVHHRQSANPVVARPHCSRVLALACRCDLGFGIRDLTNAPGDRYRRVSVVLARVLALNLAVALAKIIFGYASGAISILSDGFHSLTDAASNVVGMVGIRAARQPPDADHPYGHRKYETVAAAIVTVFLLLVVVEVLRNASNHLTGKAPPHDITPASFVV